MVLVALFQTRCNTRRHACLVQLLIDANAAVDAANSDGDTALMNLRDGHEACARLLIDGEGGGGCGGPATATLR